MAKFPRNQVPQFPTFSSHEHTSDNNWVSVFGVSYTTCTLAN